MGSINRSINTKSTEYDEYCLSNSLYYKLAKKFNFIMAGCKLDIVDGKKSLVKGSMPNWRSITKTSSLKSFKNIITIAGKVSGITIFDFDIDKETGEDAFDKFEEVIGQDFYDFCADYGMDFIRLKTPSGGCHIIFKYTEQFKTTTNAFGIKGFDIRNDGSVIFGGFGYNVVNIHKDEIEDYEFDTIDNDLYNILIKHEESTKQVKTVEVKDIDVKDEVVDKTKKKPRFTNKQYEFTLKQFKIILKNLKKKRFDDYDNWMKIGTILKYYLQDEGFDLFHKYSAKSKKYVNKEDCLKYYNNFNNDVEDDKKLSIGTLMYYLQEDTKEHKYIDIVAELYDIDIEVDLRKHDLSIHYDDYRDKFIDPDYVWAFEELVTYFKQRIFYLENSQCFFIKKLIKEDRFDKRTNKNEVFKYIDYIAVKDVYTDNKKIYYLTDYQKIPLKTVIHQFFKPILSIENVVFKPYSVKYKQCVGKRDLNLYYDINESCYDKNFKIDQERIKIILEHIRYVICDNDDVLYDYIIKYIAFKLKKPFLKTEISILLHSVQQGTGKTAFYHLLQKLFGDRYVTDSSVTQLQKTFNAAFTRCLFIILEETEKGLTKNVNDFLKKTITQKKIQEEKKGMETIELPDYREIMILTNNFDTVKLDNQDRRYCCINVSDCKKNNYEHFNNFYDFINNIDDMKHLYHYFINTSIKDFDTRKFPETELKREMIEEYEDSITLFVKYVNDNVEKILLLPWDRLSDNDKKIKTTDLHLKYKEFCKDHLSVYDEKKLIRFSKEIRKYYEKVHKKDGYYFVLSNVEF
jgi:hypothetical protein